jgi:hypothetical protein
MLFWIFVTILIAGIIWYWMDELSDFAPAIIVVSAIAVGVSLFIIGINHIGKDAYIDKMEVRRDALVYQYENEIYENDNDLGKRELMEDIREWNEQLAHGKKIHDNFWVGIYYADYYTMFEPIELKGD